MFASLPPWSGTQANINNHSENGLICQEAREPGMLYQSPARVVKFSNDVDQSVARGAKVRGSGMDR